MQILYIYILSIVEYDWICMLYEYDLYECVRNYTYLLMYVYTLLGSSRRWTKRLWLRDLRPRHRPRRPRRPHRPQPKCCIFRHLPWRNKRKSLGDSEIGRPCCSECENMEVYYHSIGIFANLHAHVNIFRHTMAYLFASIMDRLDRLLYLPVCMYWCDV